MLLVARNRRNLSLLEEVAADAAEEIETVSTPSELGELPRERGEHRLALVDVDDYSEEVWAMIERLTDAGVRVIVLTRLRGSEVQSQALFHGVSLLLEKPVRRQNLQAIVRTHLQKADPDAEGKTAK